jgi:hypothetical protein
VSGYPFTATEHLSLGQIAAKNINAVCDKAIFTGVGSPLDVTPWSEGKVCMQDGRTFRIRVYEEPIGQVGEKG